MGQRLRRHGVGPGPVRVPHAYRGVGNHFVVVAVYVESDNPSEEVARDEYVGGFRPPWSKIAGVAGGGRGEQLLGEADLVATEARADLRRQGFRARRGSGTEADGGGGPLPGPCSLLLRFHAVARQLPRNA